jgi:cation diffusion facilitator CzcD-associated flavoprotein CzcO
VLDIKNLATQEIVVQKFDILITAIGRFNAWKLPDYPGIGEYQGHLRHSSNWDPSFDPKNKTVAVIGNGASGIQVVPELQKVVKRLDHYARSPTWIAGSFGAGERKAEPILFPPSQLKDFEDPIKYLEYRKGIEESYWRRFAGLFKNSKANLTAKEEFKAVMKKRLGDKPELLDAIVPDFPPHCRRLTPGPGYLEALTKDNVIFIQTAIKRFTKDGIETVDGVHRIVDAIICSTGANIDYAPPFPIISGDLNLAEVWKPDGNFGFPYSYLGIATPGFPNLFFIHGPNASGHSGTLPHSAENQITYIARVSRKISKEGIKTIAPSKAAADDFVEYCDTFFPKTVLSDGCSSWSNGQFSCKNLSNVL